MIDNYDSVKLAFFHTSKLLKLKKIIIFYDKPLLREFITTFVINMSHLLGVIFTIKNKFLQKKMFFP